MLIAEGSDWFWWYGDDHSSDHDLEFDDLFRRHVRNVYRALDHPVPEELFVTNITTQPPATSVEPATGFIEPAIDGEVTSYFEWVGAGSVDVTAIASTMHKAEADRDGLTAIEFGFSLDKLFLRIEGPAPARELLRADVQIRIRFLKPAGSRVVIDAPGSDGRTHTRLEVRETGYSTWRTDTCQDLASAAGEILEVQIPFRCLNVLPRGRVAFLVSLHRAGAEVAHYPPHAPIEFDVPDPTFAARNWTA